MSDEELTDEELVRRLREGATWDDDVAAADRIEALTEQLKRLVAINEAARADAKKAEGYAEELETEIELNEQEACMLENDLIKADKEIDNLKVKLAKAVEGLRQIAEQTKGVTPEPDNLQIAIGSIHSYARALLAEIEGEKG